MVNKGCLTLPLKKPASNQSLDTDTPCGPLCWQHFMFGDSWPRCSRWATIKPFSLYHVASRQICLFSLSPAKSYVCSLSLFILLCGHYRPVMLKFWFDYTESLSRKSDETAVSWYASYLSKAQHLYSSAKDPCDIIQKWERHLPETQTLSIFFHTN